MAAIRALRQTGGEDADGVDAEEEDEAEEEDGHGAGLAERGSGRVWRMGRGGKSRSSGARGQLEYTAIKDRNRTQRDGLMNTFKSDSNIEADRETTAAPNEMPICPAIDQFN